MESFGATDTPRWYLNSTCNKCFKRSIITNNGIRFDARFRFSEDEEFVWKFLSASKTIRLVSVATYTYFGFDTENHKYAKHIWDNVRFHQFVSIYRSKAKIGLDDSWLYSDLILLTKFLVSNIKSDWRQSLNFLKEYLETIHLSRFLRIFGRYTLVKLHLSRPPE